MDEINSGSPTLKAYLQKLLIEIRLVIEQQSISDAIANTKASFIMVPTPSGNDDLFVNDYVLSCVMDIG